MDFDPIAFKAEIKEEFNTALNGLAAKFAKQNAPPTEPPKPPTESAPPEPTSEQKLTLKSLETKLGQMTQQLEAAESRRQEAVKTSALSAYSSQSVDKHSYEILFKSQHGTNLVADGDTVYVKSGTDIIPLEEAIATFNTTGGGKFLAQPTIEFSKGAVQKPGTETPTAPSEQQQLEHFLADMKANS